MLIRLMKLYNILNRLLYLNEMSVKWKATCTLLNERSAAESAPRASHKVLAVYTASILRRYCVLENA